MAFEQYTNHKKAFVLGLDDILYPEKDYLLQVYYLFAEFIEYAVQINAKDVLDFMQAEFSSHGDVNIFEKTAEKFTIPKQYEENFKLLHQTARLPLKLLPYQQVLSFLQEVVLERKEIYLLVDGDPLQQLNKIKQMEWHGLEQYLKVYFTAEFEAKPLTGSMEFILNAHQLSKEEVLFIGCTTEDQQMASSFKVDYLLITELI